MNIKTFVAIVIMVNGTSSLCAMDQQAVVKRNEVIKQIAIAVPLISKDPIKAFNLLSQAYKQAEVRLASKVEAKKDGRLLWKVVLPDGSSDFEDDGVLWMALLNQVELLRVKSTGALADDVNQLSVLVGRSFTLNAAQKQFFSGNKGAMLEGWYLFQKLKEPTVTDLLVLRNEREAELNAQKADDEEALTNWQEAFLDELPEESVKTVHTREKMHNKNFLKKAQKPNN